MKNFHCIKFKNVDLGIIRSEQSEWDEKSCLSHVTDKGFHQNMYQVRLISKRTNKNEKKMQKKKHVLPLSILKNVELTNHQIKNYS